MSDGLPTLMRAQMAAEFELAHTPLQARLTTLRNALSGIASCATRCGCCQMHREIATEALARDDSTTPTPPPSTAQR